MAHRQQPADEHVRLAGEGVVAVGVDAEEKAGRDAQFLFDLGDVEHAGKGVVDVVAEDDRLREGSSNFSNELSRYPARWHSASMCRR